ncbi:MAG: superfamily hydrolase [Myxococcaceae bacterium]|nr:superfamily hydrolase [Myxococcaceae bacterium]
MPKLDAVLNPQALKVVAPLLAVPGAGRAVCFDADGTIWRGDVGEDLLRFLVAEDRLPAHPGERDLYRRYEHLHEVDPPAAYAFAVEAMAGLEEARLQGWCREFYAQRFAGRLFPFTRPLLEAFCAAGYVVWLVSASPRWIVEAGAAALGVDHVIAVDAELEAGRLTPRVRRPVPAGPGKVELLKQRGIAPVFAAGNGALDLPMLEYAAARLVVAPWDDPGNALVEAGLERGWPVQRG